MTSAPSLQAVWGGARKTFIPQVWITGINAILLIAIYVRFLQELVTRTSLETGKLDMMAEMSAVKLKYAAMEKDRAEFEQRYYASQVWKYSIFCCSLATNHLPQSAIDRVKNIFCLYSRDGAEIEFIF